MNRNSNLQNQNQFDPSAAKKNKPNKKIIGVMSIVVITIVIGFLVSVPLARLAGQRWFSSPTSTNVAVTPAISTDVTTATFTHTSFVTVTLMPGNAPITPTNTQVPPTQTPVPPKMIVVLQANKRGGDAPLSVKFNAVASFVQRADGTKSKCDQYVCKFTWSVYDPGQKIIGEPLEWRESYSYTFDKTGLYTVKVTICQGDVCGDGSIAIGAN